MYDSLGDVHSAVEWFERLNMHLPQDPGVLARLGALHARCASSDLSMHYSNRAQLLCLQGVSLIHFDQKYHTTSAYNIYSTIMWKPVLLPFRLRFGLPQHQVTVYPFAVDQLHALCSTRNLTIWTQRSIPDTPAMQQCCAQS